MVTAGMSDAGTLRALESGAAGIFLKHSPPAQLVEAIYKVMSGEMWLDSRAVRSLVAGASGKSDEQRTAQPLTERERAVLKGVFEGLTNKEIAAQLQIFRRIRQGGACSSCSTRPACGRAASWCGSRSSD